MKRVLKVIESGLMGVASLILATAVLATLTTVVRGQSVPGTLVQMSPTRLDATTNFATSASSAATITISPPGGQYVYITAVEVQNCAGAAVTAAAPLSVTSTGLGGGTTPVWTVGTTSTAGICNPSVTNGYFTPIKSNSSGANVTFVLPTFTTNQTVRVNVWYYFGA